ncbi:MAG: hypothetical protein QXX41_14465 [Nitrososphaerota archaeon]
MKTKTTFGWFITAVLLISIVAPMAFVKTAKAQGTITLSSANLHPNKVLEIKVIIPGLEATSIDLRVTDAAGTPLEVIDKDSNSLTVFKAYRVGVGVFYAYLGGTNVNLAMIPKYPLVVSNDAIVRLKGSPNPDTTLNLEVLGHGLVASIPYSTVGSTVSLDRDKVPSRRSNEFKVTLTVTDQDLNLDPTAVDELTTYPIKLDVSHIDGQTGQTTTRQIQITGVKETAVNSGTFKPAVTVDSITPGGVTIKKGDIFLLTVYSGISWGDDNMKVASAKIDVTYTYPTVSITFNQQGAKITITSPDDNVDPVAKDTLETVKTVSVSLFGAPVAPVDIDGSGFEETSANSGVFTRTLTVSWDTNYALTATAVTLKVDVKSYTLTATYLDMSGSGTYTPVPPTVDIVKQTPAKVLLQVGDTDLNSNAFSIDTLQTSVDATNDVIKLTKATLPLYELVIKKSDGTTLDIPAGYTNDKVNFFETDFNTGVFKLVMASQGLFEAGKSYTIVITDHTGLYVVQVPVTITPVTIDLDRAEYPVNRDKSLTIYVKFTNDIYNADPQLKDQVSAGTLRYKIVNPVTDETISDANVDALVETEPDSGVFSGIITVLADLPKYIDAKITVYLASDPAVKCEATFKAYQLSATDMKVEPTKVNVTGSFTITITDPDANVNSFRKDSVDVAIVVGANTYTKSLTETEPNSGRFTLTVKASEVGATPASKIIIRYQEKTPVLSPTATTFAGAEYYITATVNVASYSGTVAVPKNWIGPYEVMRINVTDPDLNMLPDLAESKPGLIKITVEGTAVTKSIDTTETGLDTGVFSGKINLPVILTGLQAPLPKELAPYIGKTITIVYVDEVNAEGNKATVIETLTITAMDAEIETDKAAVKIGETFKITINNPDIAENPTPAFRTVTVKSTTYPTGVSLYASEVSPGVYEVSVTAVSLNDWVVGAPQIPAKLGDILTILYEDPIAATGESKMITKTVNVGVPVERPVPASNPKFVDPNTGAELTTVSVGQTVMLQATVTNVDAVSKTFTAIFKVKDASGATIYIGWASGTLAPGQSLTQAISWTPTAPGTYTIEILVVKSISDPVPYSDKLTMTLTVV